MLTLLGYKITQEIHEGINTLIYRGIRERDEQPVIIKILKAQYPTLEHITRLKHEYKITQNLSLEGVVKVYNLEDHQNRLALILEDFGGESLTKILSSQKPNLTTFLRIAIQITQALSSLHQNQIIHKDIKPSNIIINRQTGDVKLTDFSIASRLGKENPQINNLNQVEGTLAYMSPEQTGRMNRSLDYRTDFYSLGVTFYEMLAGQLPFQSNDTLELVHLHIAKQPTPPQQLNPEIPQAISEIVMKLMAKNAENRYQSVLGIKADLEKCLSQLQSEGKITNFIPGQLDRSGQLLIPQKLYGRENEVSQLLAAFERVSFGNSEMMLVSGYSGIGKSSLVNEVHKPILRQRGYFISGKFDQFKRNIPYASLIQAFQSLMRQLLTENAAKLQGWKEKLLAVLGANGQVIIDVIPEVEMIVGKQPKVPQVGLTESENRFNRIFKEFIHVFAKKEHPLVIFLDDLQWADSASLKLMQLLITDSDSQYLLLMGAYRDNEVSPTHLLMQTLDEIKKIGATVNNIILQALDLTHIKQLIADTLSESHSSRNRVSELANLLFNKTQGNPFFLTQMLRALYQEELLNFDFIEGRWLWNIEQIQAVGITDKSVVELIADSIQKLQENTQEVLKLAACIGNQFTLDVLAIVHEESLSITAEQMWALLQAGLILPLTNDYKIPLVFAQEEMDVIIFKDLRISYKFLHDRVQQAAYSLIPDDRKKETHRKIGQLLLKNTPPAMREENIFDIVNQLNIGVDSISEQLERDELAFLNLIAGKKAKASAAYQPAFNYLQTSVKLLGEDTWLRQYDLTLEVYVEAGEAAYLSIEFEQMEQLIQIVLKQARSLLDKVKVYEVTIQAYIAQNKPLSGISTALEVLNLLGIQFPQKPSTLNIVLGLLETKLALASKRIEDLINLPEMTELSKLAAMRVLSKVFSATYFAIPELVPLVVFKQVNLSVKHGNTSVSAFAYALYGLILCGRVGDIDSGYRFGQLALSLLEKLNAKEYKAKTIIIVNCFVRHWKESVREILPSCLDNYQNGLDTGDLEYAAHSINIHSYYSYLSGKELTDVCKVMGFASDAIDRLKQETILQWNIIYRQTVLNLLGQSENPCQLIGESYNEELKLPLHQQANDKTSVFFLYFNKMVLNYLFKEHNQAFENANLAEQDLEAVTGTLTFPVFYFYDSLVRLGVYAFSPKSAQKRILVKVTANQKKMKNWAHYAPTNHLHKFYLVEAELCRVMGQNVKAGEYFDRAIKGAAENGYIQEEALAYELAGEFYQSLGKDIISHAYLTKAYYAYIRWGATAKVKNLESKHLHLVAQTRTPKTVSFDITRVTTTTSSSGFNSSLDLATFIKASQAITSEIILERLLIKLIKILLENAAAQKGFVVLFKDNQLFIEASKTDTEDEVTVLQSIPIETSQELPISIVNYVFRTQENLVLNDAIQAETFATDPYILNHQPQSILCYPIIYQTKLQGIIYLENNLTSGAFTPERLEILKLLTSQVAIAIENARFYRREQEKSQQLAQSLEKLKQTQAQLVQTEKISSLGQLVAGVAHEVNNPVNFLSGNLHHANEYVQDLLKHLQLYQQHYPNPPVEIIENSQDIELEFLAEDLPKMISSMQLGTDRIREIMQSLRNFSRVDEAEKKFVDIHSGIDSTLMILQHRLKAKPQRPGIQVIKKYGELPLVECYPGQLNQVFMNLLANAIDALEEYNNGRTFTEIERNPNIITILTQVISFPVVSESLWPQRGNPTPYPSPSHGEGRRREGQRGKTNNFDADEFDIKYQEKECNPKSKILSCEGGHRDGNRQDAHFAQNPKSVVIRIADNGPGIPESVQQRLFDPFFTTKPVGKGTGLGLSISYQIVTEKHKGRIDCISAPGQGAEFAIEIPVRQHSEKSANG
ncbi:trifunctional serine/threonine-protein kinase/ATP-binding protein/sensor histidine kinase [Argonema galeatum]|uniref:trifunctional serine/threonine-protein kinase/ATP-binding protein/sensor histidine kinase n=1 Tax=Argonema galeatum TaxID=2942762 RepID=UPI003B84A9C3